MSSSQLWYYAINGENGVKTIQDIFLLIPSLHVNLQLSAKNVKEKKSHIKKHIRGTWVGQFALEFYLVSFPESFIVSE